MSDADDTARRRALEYLRRRGTEAPPTVLRERIAAAFAELDQVVGAVTAEEAARPGPPGEWTVQEVVDHLVETHRPGLDELRCLLAGRRPPGQPIPASLQSRAPLLRPWPWLRRELRTVHGDIQEALAGVPDGFATEARAPVVMVVPVPDPAGGRRILQWIEELDWKAYAIVWRVHALEHLEQIRQVLGAVRGGG